MFTKVLKEAMLRKALTVVMKCIWNILILSIWDLLFRTQILYHNKFFSSHLYCTMMGDLGAHVKISFSVCSIHHFNYLLWMLNMSYKAQLYFIFFIFWDIFCLHQLCFRNAFHTSSKISYHTTSTTKCWDSRHVKFVESLTSGYCSKLQVCLLLGCQSPVLQGSQGPVMPGCGWGQVPTQGCQHVVTTLPTLRERREN